MTKKTKAKLTPDIQDALNYLREFGLGDIFNVFASEHDRPDVFLETYGKPYFFDMRLGELFLKDDAKCYTVTEYDKLNPAQKANMGKFIWEILFSNRVIKLYDDEFDKLSDITQTTLIHNSDFTEQTRKEVHDYHEKTKGSTTQNCKPINS